MQIAIRPWTPPRHWPRWRTCTAPTSLSAAPVPPSPGRGAWSPWRSSCPPGAGPVWSRRRRPETMWILRGAWRRSRTPFRGPATSWQSRSQTTRRCGKKLRQQYLRRAMLVSKAADAEPKDSVYRLYYGFKCPVSKVQGYQTLAINRGGAGGLPEGLGGAGPGVCPCDGAPGGGARPGLHGLCPGGGGRRLRPADPALYGAGDPQLPHRPGGRGGHPHVRPEPEAPAHAAPGEGAGDHGAGPGLPHGL